MELKKPDLNWKKLMGGMLIYLGFLCLLIGVHVASIEADTADTQNVMHTTQTVFLWFYIAALVFGAAGVIIQYLAWLAWHATTPKWLKEQQRQNK